MKPNILLITTDQQRYDSVGVNGSSFIRTPHMDRLGREGVSFARAYCPNTVCTPSRVSMMTGLHVSRHGAYNIGTYAHDYSGFLSHLLRDHGYRTHHVGKAHWHPWQVESPETASVDEQGTPFRDFVGFDTAELSVGHAGRGGVSGHYAAWMKEKGASREQFQVNPMFADDPNGTGTWELPKSLHSGTWVAERAVQLLEQHKQHSPDQPFFLNLGFQDPHHPHLLPHDYADVIDPDLIPAPDTDIAEEGRFPEQVPYFQQGGISTSRFMGKFMIGGNSDAAWQPYFSDAEKSKWTRAYYYSMVQLFDEQLGMILDALDRLGLRDSTLVICTSDHGEMLGDHAIGQKGPLAYEGVTHIPLMMRYPDGFGPCQVADCVSLVDMLPTIADFAGIHDERRRDGISLKPALQQGTSLARSGVRIEYKEEPDRIRFKCWVTPEWKMAVYAGETFGELYDLRNDPGEKHNLYDQPAYADVRQRLFIDMLADMERSEPVSVRPCRV